MFFANGSLLAVNGKTVWHTNTKNVEPVLSLVPLCKALALPCLSKRATLKAPRMCIYVIPTIRLLTNNAKKKTEGMDIIHSYEAFPLPCF